MGHYILRLTLVICFRYSSQIQAVTSGVSPVTVDIRFREGLPDEDTNDADDLAVLQDIWASDDGFQDGDGNDITPDLYRYPLGTELSSLEEHGWWNPFHEGSYERWIDNQLILGAHVREAEYSEHADTGRPAITSSIDDIPVLRNPGTETFDYPLNDWDISQFIETRLSFRLNFSNEDEVDVDNINDQEDVIAFLNWLESIRHSGDAVGENVTALGSFTNRVFRFDQGGDADTVDMEIYSSGQFYSGDYLAYIDLGFDRVDGDTDDFDIDAIRTLFDTLTVSVTVDSDDAIEEPERGSTDIAYRASKIIFPNNLVLEPVGTRMTIKHETMGRFAIDGSSVRAIRYDDLDDVTGESNTKWMPNTGESVIHFGHSETSDGHIRFRNSDEMLLADGSDLVLRVHNVSTSRNCYIDEEDGTRLLTLLPLQKSGPILFAMEQGGTNGEIHFLDPPTRNIILSRGVALPNFGGATSYPEDDGSNAHNYRTLQIPSSAIEFRDEDGWGFGNSADPSTDVIDDISASMWDIKGSYQIKMPGWVSIQLRYRLEVDPGSDTALGSMPQGNGPSLWISEGGTGTISIDHFSGHEEFGGEGAVQEYRMVYRGRHTTGTRFIFLHRFPNGSDFAGEVSGVAYNNRDHIKMRNIGGSLVLDPEIRKVL